MEPSTLHCLNHFKENHNLQITIMTSNSQRRKADVPQMQFSVANFLKIRNYISVANFKISKNDLAAEATIQE